jgi:hypothetical protein
MSFDCHFSMDGIDYDLWIEDDDRVCYAYLLDADEKICADVWLYNRIPAPDGLQHAGGVALVNQERFAAPASFPLPTSADAFSAQWYREGGVLYARIYIQRELIAILAPGTQPGWSVLAKEDGPVAKALTAATPGFPRS